MHFMAMIGFGLGDEPVRYDLTLTAASLLIAIVVVAIGLMIVGFGRPTALKIITAGTLTGVGVAGMHYTGMAAMRMPAHTSYDPKIVGLSVAIAIVAATVALWFTVSLNSAPMLFIAALIMGVAVNGMHFTGMYALKVGSIVPGPVAGLSPLTFLGPIVVFVVAAIAVLLFALLSRSGLDHGDATVPIASTIAPTSAVPSASASTSARTNTVAAFGHRRR
jgi:NO-binding membrane sensor protein with MHYT domain